MRTMDRDVAQLGSALDWGSRGRRFKSCHPDRTRPGISTEVPGLLHVCTRNAISYPSRVFWLRWALAAIMSSAARREVSARPARCSVLLPSSSSRIMLSRYRSASRLLQEALLRNAPDCGPPSDRVAGAFARCLRGLQPVDKGTEGDHGVGSDALAALRRPHASRPVDCWTSASGRGTRWPAPQPRQGGGRRVGHPGRGIARQGARRS